jgi:hypothetical protein
LLRSIVFIVWDGGVAQVIECLPSKAWVQIPVMSPLPQYLYSNKMRYWAEFIIIKHLMSFSHKGIMFYGKFDQGNRVKKNKFYPWVKDRTSCQFWIWQFVIIECTFNKAFARMLFNSRYLSTFAKQWTPGSTESWLFLFLFFGCTGSWTQGCTLAKQVHYCLSHSVGPFLIGYFLR